MAEYVLPQHLVGRAFTRRQARAEAIHDSELRRRRELSHPAHGAWTTEETETLVGLCRGVLPVLPPGSAFSHITGARLRALPLPPRLDAQTELDVMTVTGVAPPRRPSWIGHEGAESRQVVQHLGVPVVGLVDSWCDLAAFAVGRSARMDVADLVVLGDDIVNRLILERMQTLPPALQPTRPLRDAGEIATALRAFDVVIDRRVRPRGKRAMMAAVPLISAGVRSPQETRARLAFVRAGFPEPEVNVDVHDDAGGWLGECDLVWRERRVVVEYQSEHHVDRRQRSRDSAKTSSLVAAGWAVHEMWAEDCHPGLRQVGLLRRVARSLGIDARDLGLT